MTPEQFSALKAALTEYHETHPTDDNGHSLALWAEDFISSTTS